MGKWVCIYTMLVDGMREQIERSDIEKDNRNEKLENVDLSKMKRFYKVKGQMRDGYRNKVVFEGESKAHKGQDQSHVDGE